MYQVKLTSGAIYSTVPAQDLLLKEFCTQLSPKSANLQWPSQSNRMFSAFKSLEIFHSIFTKILVCCVFCLILAIIMHTRYCTIRYSNYYETSWFFTCIEFYVYEETEELLKFQLHKICDKFRKYHDYCYCNWNTN